MSQASLFLHFPFYSEILSSLLTSSWSSPDFCFIHQNLDSGKKVLMQIIYLSVKTEDSELPFAHLLNLAYTLSTFKGISDLRI